MGDRAQVFIEDEKVYLYTHWNATELPEIVANALARGKERWDDPEYLTRIIFSEMIKDDINGLTGYGIGTTKHNDIWRLITISCSGQIIKIEDEGKPFQQFRFPDFIAKYLPLKHQNV
jgi:hypothetical protein